MTASSTPRVTRSRDKLRAAGGTVTTIRLSPEAEAAVQRIIAAGQATTRRGAIEWALFAADAGMDWAGAPR